MHLSHTSRSMYLLETSCSSAASASLRNVAAAAMSRSGTHRAASQTCALSAKSLSQQTQLYTVVAHNAADATGDCPLISSQPGTSATAECSSQSGAAVDQVQIWGQLQHTGHTPGTKESEKHLPINEVIVQSSNNSSAIVPMTPVLFVHALQRLAAKADKWPHQHSPAEVEIMLERKQLQGMTCPDHRWLKS